MKDLFEVEVKTTLTLKGNSLPKLPKGVTKPVEEIVTMAMPFIKRLMEAWTKQEEATVAEPKEQK